ncbi:hypothetical protein GCM10009530_44350 [Microbispora corallina]|uniref:Insertion element IS402-like domain-containing protein n=1 Tax=Microbispora corallina TaxID=83302 RepID=A0ABQ4FWW4_9ACTN|nr:hypothetical protein Mco01_23060 [Microbispora corallina]
MTTFMDRPVPDELWELFQRVVPPSPTRPQGGGRRRADDRLILAAIIFVATTSCTWRQLAPVFGASWQTVHRRFAEWSAARVWAKLCRILLDDLGSRGELNWSRSRQPSLGAARAGRPADPLTPWPAA